jgi:TPR repeat protein
VGRWRNVFGTAQLYVGVAGGVILAVSAVARLTGAELPWAVTAAGVVSVLAALLGQVIDPIRGHRAEIVEAKQLQAQAAERFRAVLYDDPATINQANLYEMGVFRSDAAERFSMGLRPPYVERSIDKVLRPTIAAMAHSGGLVVVRGAPKSGKSRTLWEALSYEVGSRIVYGVRPPIGTGHRRRPITTFLDNVDTIESGRSIIWIDDAHEHFGYGLDDDTVLTRDLLGRFPGVIVAMTVHTHRLEEDERADAAEPQAVDTRLLDHLREASNPYELDVKWRGGELDEARAAFPGLEAQLENPDDFKTLARWFAGVNHLQERYQKAKKHPRQRGLAVAKAAIDWRRAGMPAGMTTEELCELAEVELRELDSTDYLSAPAFQEGLDWARGEDERGKWKGVALLRPIAGTDPTLWRDFDAVPARAPTIDGPLSDRCWDFIARHLTPDNAFPVGLAASRANKPTMAETAFRHGADLGDARAMVGVGLTLVVRGDEASVAEAEAWWRRAADQGAAIAMSNLGVLLRDRGDEVSLAEAEAWWRRAADLDHARAMYNLGVLLEGRGEEASVAEAEAWYRRAAEQGDAGAMSNLGVLLEERDDEDAMAEAVWWWGRAAELGDADAMVSLGMLVQGRGDEASVAEAEAWYRRAADLDHAAAMANLGMLLRDRGDEASVAEADRWFEQARQLGLDAPQ